MQAGVHGQTVRQTHAHAYMRTHTHTCTHTQTCTHTLTHTPACGYYYSAKGSVNTTRQKGTTTIDILTNIYLLTISI